MSVRAEWLFDFSSPTTLENEHRRLMESHHRKVDYSQSTASQLSDSVRSVLIDLWRARTLSEHRSVSIFATYTLDLLAAGAPAEVLSLACRASLDEVRHAELFAKLTRCYSGVEETPSPGISVMPEAPEHTMTELAAIEALHLCVGAESYSAALLHTLFSNAKDPVVRDVVAIVLADEIHHARMGWAFIASLLRGKHGEAVHAVLQPQLYPTLKGLSVGLLGTEAEEPTLLTEQELEIARGHGYLTLKEQRTLFQETVTDIWIPSLAALGFDSSALGRLTQN